MRHAPRANRWLDAISPYIPGATKGTGDGPTIKLSSNESPLGPNPRALEAMAACAREQHLYPDGGTALLRHAIADAYALEPERIVCGAGSDELLFLLAQGFAGPGDEILSVRHGFMIYPIAAYRVGATPVLAPDTADYTTDVDALLAAITPRTKVLFLANPNNPTGTSISSAQMQRLLDGVPETVLVVLDAAYAEYMSDTAYQCGLDFARHRPNVVVTRTFSKIYGLAGMRVGWAYGPAAVMEVLNKIRSPFNVNRIAQAGAVSAIADKAWVTAARQHNDQWRPWLAGELTRLGLAPLPSGGNFLLVEFPDTAPLTAAAANTALLAAGYLVRHLPGMGLPNHLRISIGTEAELRGFVTALSTALAAA